MDQSAQRKLVAGAVAGLAVVGIGAVAGAAVGAGPLAASGSGTDSARDLAERGTAATTDSSTPGTTPDSTPGSLPGGGDDGGGGARTETSQLVDVADGTTQTLAAGTAGFVTVARNGSSVSVLAVSPGAGWTFEIEPGDEPGEAEVDFRNGAARVQFNAELEDGAVRVRVRTRGMASTPGPTVGTLPGGDSSGPGSNGDFDDGPNGDFDDGPDGDFDDGAGHDVGDDHGGASGHDGSDDSSGSGSDNSGSDGGEG